MSKSNSIYFLLFMLLIMGGFAAMAQNDYGITILGMIGFAFAALFASQLLPMLTGKEVWVSWDVLELGCLCILASIMGLRVFYIHFEFVEWIFGAAGAMLVVAYVFKLIQTYREIQGTNNQLSWLAACFHSSIIFYTLSTVLVPFVPWLAEPAGAIGFALLIAFVIANYWKKNLMLKGEKITDLAFVGRSKDRSVVLLSLFLLFTLYIGFTKIGVIPKMYSDEFPQSYFQLINQAETGAEKPIDGKYKHEGFKEAYNRFVGRHTPE
jgi:hypothetical protein